MSYLSNEREFNDYEYLIKDYDLKVNRFWSFGAKFFEIQECL